GECGRRRDGRRRTDAGGRTGRPRSKTVVDSSGLPRCCPLLALGWLRQPVAVDVLVNGLRRDPQVVSDVEDREAFVDQLGDLLTSGGFVVSSHVRFQGTSNLGSCQPPRFDWGSDMLGVDNLTGRRLYLRPTRTTRGESGSATRKEAAWKPQSAKRTDWRPPAWSWGSSPWRSSGSLSSGWRHCRWRSSEHPWLEWASPGPSVPEPARGRRSPGWSSASWRSSCSLSS